MARLFPDVARQAAIFATVCGVALLAQVGRVGAQQSDAPSDPWRVMGLVSAGVPVRITRRTDLGQEVVAPVFLDTAVVLLWPGEPTLRHGPLLGLATNLMRDGGFYAPVDVLSQWVVLAGYAARLALSDDLFALGHVGVPFDLGASGSLGAELSAGIGYRWLAGIGAFGAATVNLFGSEGGVSVTTAIEFGLFIDYEVLP